MAVFNFGTQDDYVQGNELSILSLKDDQDYAVVRPMYGEGESFKGHSIHKVFNKETRKRYEVSCLYEPGGSIDDCPLCKEAFMEKDQKVKNEKMAKEWYYIPFYVEKIVTASGTETIVNKVLYFGKGASFRSNLQAIIRNSDEKPFVNTLFRLVRNGVAKDPKTTYQIEKIRTDNTTLADLPPIPPLTSLGFYKEVDAQDMLQFCQGGASSQVVPRNTHSDNNYQETDGF